MHKLDIGQVKTLEWASMHPCTMIWQQGCDAQGRGLFGGVCVTSDGSNPTRHQRAVPAACQQQQQQQQQGWQRWGRASPSGSSSVPGGLPSCSSTSPCQGPSSRQGSYQSAAERRRLTCRAAAARSCASSCAIPATSGRCWAARCPPGRCGTSPAGGAALPATWASRSRRCCGRATAWAQASGRHNPACYCSKLPGFGLEDAALAKPQMNGWMFKLACLGPPGVAEAIRRQQRARSRRGAGSGQAHQPRAKTQASSGLSGAACVCSAYHATVCCPPRRLLWSHACAGDPAMQN